MFNFLSKKLTKNYWVDFNLNKHIENGAENSCMVKIHPVLKDDEYIHQTLNNLVDYIRENYDMEIISR